MRFGQWQRAGLVRTIGARLPVRRGEGERERWTQTRVSYPTKVVGCGRGGDVGFGAVPGSVGADDVHRDALPARPGGASPGTRSLRRVTTAVVSGAQGVRWALTPLAPSEEAMKERLEAAVADVAAFVERWSAKSLDLPTPPAERGRTETGPYPAPAPVPGETVP
jgi:hypothetical protein